MMLARKNSLKRVLSSFLALVMLLGLLPASAFAAGNRPAEVVHQGEVVVSEDGLVTVQKTARHTSGDNFEITLKVTTKDQVTTTPAQDTHVVLVIDRSNSMAGQRIKSTRQAAKEFAQIVLSEDAAEDNQIAVVSYTRNWESRIGLSGDLEAVETAIDQVNTYGNEGYGGTNIQSGIYAAEQILAQDSSDADKVIVLFSDGYPTYCYMLDGTATGACTAGIMWPGDVNASTIQITGRNTNKIIGPGNDSEIQGDWWDWFNLFTGDNLALKTTCTIDESVHNFFHGKNHTENTNVKYNYETGTISNRADTSWNTIWEADQAKTNAELYTVLLSPSNHSEAEQAKTLMAKLASEGKYYETSNTSDLAEIFKGIAGSITKPTNAGTVTDPMGQFITLGDVSGLADKGVTKTENGLTWNVSAVTPVENSDGSKTYTVTYPITLDTSAQGFMDGQEYATNGTTTFNYQFDGNNRSVNFDVPTVKGYVPTVNYTINYWYKDKESGEYKVGKTDSDSAKLWSKITIDSGAYSKENYRFNNGPTGTQTLTADNLVFDLYYDPITANVVVKHWVSTVDQTDTGDVYHEPVLQDTDPYPNLYKGDKFTNEKFLDEAIYTKVESVTVGDTTYTTDDYTDITLPEGTTVIDIYYTMEGENERTPVNYEIHYWYREDSWKLNDDGKYEKVTGTYAEDTSVLIQKKDYHGVTINAPDRAGVYTLDSDKTTATSMVLDKDKTNRLDIYYYKDAPTEPTADKATLTIKHVYKQETINGVVEVEADNWTEKDNVTVYVGETWYANPEPKGYTLVTESDARQVTITEADKHYEIVVEYYKDVREPVDIVMNHYYTTYTWTVDPVTGEGNWDAGVQTDKLEGVHATGTWYVGQTYEPSQIAQGYTYVSGGDAAVLTSGTNTFNLYYETYVGSEDDEADVTVNHIYTTYRSYVDADGNVVLNEASSETESEETRYGMKGDTFTTQAQVKDDFTFVKADTDDLLVTLRGEGGQYNLYYEKYVNELGDSYAVTVQPIYKTYTTSVNDEGQIVTNPTTENGAPVTLTGDFYEGQKVTALAADYGKDGFTYAPDDEDNTAGLTIAVSATGENVIYVVYSKTDSSSLGLPGVVLVNNVYTTITKYIDANGELQTKESSITGSNTTYGPYYVGQFFDTTGKSTQREGYVLDTREGITQPADSVKIEKDGQQITFYWLQEVDETVPATVKVVHHYTLKDVNPNVGTTSWTVGADSEPFTGYFAGQLYQAGYDFQNNTFAEEHVTEVVPDGAATAPGLKLVAGLNEIHIYYEKSVDSRVSTTVKVIHNYYADAEALAAGTTEATYEENPTKMEADSYTATLRTEHNGLLYTFDSATPEGYTIKVNKDASKNVITISYIRAETNYTVVHQYYTDGSLTGFTERTVSGKVGATINAADITKETSYGGNTYSYTSVDKETLTLAADAKDNVITLRYDRTTYDPDPYPTTDPDDGDKETNIPEETTPLDPGPEPSVEPTPEPTEEPDVEIPEETTPLGPGPDEPEDPEIDIPEDGTPLGNLPQTGAVAAPVNPATTAGLVALAFSMAGCGLYFTFGRKKGEEED